jgi:endo-1,4-beta-xylanase
MPLKLASLGLILAAALLATGCTGGAGGGSVDASGGASGTGVAGTSGSGTGGGAGSGGQSGGASGGSAGGIGGSGAGAGTIGTGGTAGTGAGGTGAVAGTTGAGGTGGSAGTTGTAGTTAGAAGRGGTTGTGGAAGRGGTTGTGGAAGRGGTTGTGGSAGAGGTTPCTGTTLKAAATCSGRMFGAALAASHLAESAYATAAREHNFVTPENEMKWDQIEPTRGTFTFGPADQIVSFAMTNNMKVKGHTLVWHKQLPTWVTSLTTAADVRKAMVDHINGVMNHFKGKVTVWDVVNEAWLTDGRTGDGNPRIRDSVFSTVLGPSFIDEAFMAARQADSTAILVYNEFANEGLSDKSTAVYNMVKDMKMRGIPIDGVGLQMHIGYNTNPTAADLAANIQRIADLGLKVYISEMDVNSCAGYSDAQEKAQYHDVVAACVAQPACAAVTVWGITDKYTWLDINNNANSSAGCATGVLPSALLWDINYVKKSAYTGVMDALLGR